MSLTLPVDAASPVKTVPAEIRSLPEKEVHVWTLDLIIPDPLLAELSSTLSPDEQVRASRFRFAPDRNHFIAARGFLRKFLSGYLAVAPRELTFGYAQNGKPRLLSSGKNRLEFNLSHSGGWAAYAFAWNRAVGIDLEKISPLQDIDGLARQFLPPAERTRLHQLEGTEKEKEFYRLWTNYEALLKCTGQGIATIPDYENFAKNFPGSLHALRMTENFMGALAIAGKDSQLGQWRVPATRDSVVPEILHLP